MADQSGATLAKTFENQQVDHRRASDHLVRGIDFLFALTLGQGILLFQDFWLDPLHADNLPVALALFAVYFATFQSFIDWHLAMEQRPFLVTWELRFWERIPERIRVFVDLSIVMTYAYLLVNATPLITDPGYDMSPFLIGFPIVFGLYTAWSILRRIRYEGASLGRLWVVLSFAGVFLLIYLGYALISPPDWFLPSDRDQNIFTLGLVILTVFLYRVTNMIVGRRPS